jgi:hypothetical protein
MPTFYARCIYSTYRSELKVEILDSDKPRKITTTATDGEGKVISKKTETSDPKQIATLCSDAATILGLKKGQTAKLDVKVTIIRKAKKA